MTSDEQQLLIERLSENIRLMYASFGIKLMVMGILKNKRETIFIIDIAIGIDIEEILKYKSNVALLMGVKPEEVKFHLSYKGTSYIGLEVKKPLLELGSESTQQMFEDPNFIKVHNLLQQPKALDELFQEAIRIVVKNRVGSASLLQRKLKIGYNKAARYIDEMERLGIVGPHNGVGPREVLIEKE